MCKPAHLPNSVPILPTQVPENPDCSEPLRASSIFGLLQDLELRAAHLSKQTPIMQAQSSFLGQAGTTVSNVKVSEFCASRQARRNCSTT